MRKFDLSLPGFLLSVILAVGGLVWVAHQELSKIDARQAATDRQLQALQTAVKAIADSQTNAVLKDIIKDSLTVAKMEKRVSVIEARPFITLGEPNKGTYQADMPAAPRVEEKPPKVDTVVR